MTGCIYHEADLDGVMSAAIVKKYFKGDIDLLPYNYGKEIPDVNKYDKVFAGTADSSDARSIPPRRRWMSRRWHARPTHVEEAIRRLPDSSLAWRI